MEDNAAAPLSLAQIRKAYEALDSEEIPNSYRGYVSHLAEKISRRKVALSAENSLSSLIPVDFLIIAEPKIQEAMNVRNLELDKLRNQEIEEINQVHIKPLPQHLVTAIKLEPGKVKRKSRNRKKRKRKNRGGSGEPSKKRQKTKTVSTSSVNL